MTTNDEQKLESDANQPIIYQIKIKGHLSRQRMDWFEGLTITLEYNGNTLLTGTMIDQAALHGILKKVRDLGVTLLSVNIVGHSSENETGVQNQQTGAS